VTDLIEPQSRRDRPAKALLSRALIIDAALELVAQHGLEAVTLRKVADRLDTGPASLYVYVENREELLARMLDQALSQVPEVPVKHKRWRRRLIELFTEMLAALDRYPGIALAAVGSPLSLPAMAAIGDNALGLLREGGLDQRSATWARDALILFTVATAMQDAARQRTRVGAQAGVHVSTTGEEPGEPAGATGDPEQFAFALNAIIRGTRDREPD
jgi:AcrR family transcriptional regulator